MMTAALLGTLTLSALAVANEVGTIHQPLPVEHYPTSAAPPLPITQVRALHSLWDDHPVRLRGRITNQLGENAVFTDGTGTVRLDLPDAYEYGAAPLNTEVEIYGEYDKEMVGGKVDVKQIIMLTPAASRSHK